MRQLNRIFFGWFLILSALVTSCADENDIRSMSDSYISFHLTDNSLTRVTTYPEDEEISSLRILAFMRTGDANNGTIVGNEIYDMSANPVIFLIDKGTYDFVFLSNEPWENAAALSLIRKRSDLDAIAYSSSAFAADKNIPMMQTLENVMVIGNGSGKIADGEVQNPLPVDLDRMAVRLDVMLQAELDMSTVFDQVILTNLPDVIPLTSGYTGTITRNTVRNISKTEFSSATLSEGMVWAVEKERIILPASEIVNITEEDLAIELTVGMNGENYSPSCYLNIWQDHSSINYSLPKNTHLSFTGKITYPLEVNIAASKWGSESDDWEINNQRILNVSATSASITDFNGARISFWSNMPVVRVLPTVQRVDPNNTSTVLETLETNRIFNSLAYQKSADGTNLPQRFNYVTTITVDNEGTSEIRWSGSGYMDILADGWVENDGTNDVGRDVTGTYKLILSAEEEDGSNALQREIIVSIRQNGKRLQFYHPAARADLGDGATGYLGAFWKSDQYGERIIMGQNAIRVEDGILVLPEWSAEVLYEPSDMVILSTTPSQDDKVGTDNPGNAENFPVMRNWQKGEDGKTVKGNGRIYFRIGLTGPNTSGTPRYATVKLKYRLFGWDEKEAILYLRQGEEPDYLFEGRPGSRAYKVYNMTHRDFLSNPASETFGIEINKTNAVEVDFPTKAGAHFQWARLREGKFGHYSGDAEPEADYLAFGYRALNPRATLNATGFPGWGWGYYQNYPYMAWKGSTTDVNYSDYYEICPTGYHRPNDGSTIGGLYAPQNSTSTEAYASEWRASIYANPIIGDGNELYDSTNPNYNPDLPNNGSQTTIPTYYKPVPLPDNITYGFYADGYFDRRPITRDYVSGAIRYGVGLASADPAHWGTIYFNGVKSLFFPSAGIRNYGAKDPSFAGVLQYPASGYYITASAADVPEEIGNKDVDWSGIWSMELSYTQSAPVSSAFKNGYSMRCVKDE